MRRFCCLAAVGCLLAGGASAGAVVYGQVDDFQDGSTQGWGVPGSHPSPPHNEGGGMMGAGDRFLVLDALGGFGAGSKLVVLSDGHWGGDYTAAGVTRIYMNALNMGNTDLMLRLVFEDPNGGPPDNIAVSTLGVSVDAGTGWQQIFFDVTASDLTALQGTAEAALSGATLIRLMHNPDATFPPPAIVGQLGVDNITAVPEPMTLGALSLGVFALLRKRR